MKLLLNRILKSFLQVKTMKMKMNPLNLRSQSRRRKLSLRRKRNQHLREKLLLLKLREVRKLNLIKRKMNLERLLLFYNRLVFILFFLYISHKKILILVALRSNRPSLSLSQSNTLPISLKVHLYQITFTLVLLFFASLFSISLTILFRFNSYTCQVKYHFQSNTHSNKDIFVTTLLLRSLYVSSLVVYLLIEQYLLSLYICIVGRIINLASSRFLWVSQSFCLAFIQKFHSFFLFLLFFIFLSPLYYLSRLLAISKF